MYSSPAVTTSVWSVPMGARGASTEGQFGKLSKTRHSMHESGFKVHFFVTICNKNYTISSNIGLLKLLRVPRERY